MWTFRRKLGAPKLEVAATAHPKGICAKGHVRTAITLPGSNYLEDRVCHSHRRKWFVNWSRLRFNRNQSVAWILLWGTTTLPLLRLT
jgi:hypothetical protein